MANEVNLEKIAKPIFDITSRRYRQLAKEHIVPPVVNGMIDFPIACRDYIAYQRKQLEGQGSLSLTDERTRLTRINADRKELELQKERGELVSAAEMTNLLGTIARKIRQKLLAFSKKLPPLVIGLKSIAATEHKVDNFVREVLNELAGMDLDKKGSSRKSSRSGKRRARNVSTTTKTKSKRVGRKKQDSKR